MDKFEKHVTLINFICKLEKILNKNLQSEIEKYLSEPKIFKIKTTKFDEYRWEELIIDTKHITITKLSVDIKLKKYGVVMFWYSDYKKNWYIV